MTDVMELPDPLSPPECDLTDFPFMPLMIARLRKSKAWVKSKRDPALGFYMLNLWMAAWHEVPAGSLEDDDDVLMDAAMCDVSKWPRYRDKVRHGWVKCSDGRLYHPVVCERVAEAWQSKIERRQRNDHEKTRKQLERDERAKLFAVLKDAGIHKPWNTHLSELRELVQKLSGGQVSDKPKADRDLSRLREGQGDGKGEGHGQGEGQGDSIKTGAASAPKVPRKRSTKPVNPDLLGLDRLVADGVAEQSAKDWLAIRHEKNLPLTLTAWEHTQAEAAKAGLTIDAAIKYSVVRARGGFMASWIVKDAGGPGGTPAARTSNPQAHSGHSVEESV